MVIRPDVLKVKTTAREAGGRISAFYISGDAGASDKESVSAFLRKTGLAIGSSKSLMFSRRELSDLFRSHW